MGVIRAQFTYLRRGGVFHELNKGKRILIVATYPIVSFPEVINVSKIKIFLLTIFRNQQILAAITDNDSS